MMPTLAFMKRSNLEAWVKFKDAVIDVGYKYTHRINTFTSLMFGICILYMVFLLLTFFKLLKFDLPLVLWVMAICDIVTVMSIIMRVVWLGASINSSWNKEIGILIELKKEMFKVVWDYNNLKNKQFYSSRLSQILIESFRQIERSKSLSEAKEMYQETIEYIDVVVASLEHKWDNKPLKILGIKVTNQLEI